MWPPSPTGNCKPMGKEKDKQGQQLGGREKENRKQEKAGDVNERVWQEKKERGKGR